MTDRPRVLVLAQNYPSPVHPTRGLWVERLVRATLPHADPTVIAPVPWRAARAPAQPRLDPAGFPVWHPAVLGGVTHHLHPVEARLGFPRIRRLADRLHAEQSFDLIHAHFVYPDGVVAARLGRRYGIPVVTTEHAFWRPWLDRYPGVRAQVLAALPDIHTVSGVSEAVRAQVHEMVGGTVRTSVLHPVVDDRTFNGGSDAARYDPGQLLFVGFIRHVKGLDVAVHALARLARTHPTLRLKVVGDASLFRAYRRDQDAVRALVDRLALGGRVTFAGAMTPAAVAAEMRRSALLVVPSRRETFSSVTAEALACGTPVVATRCGGPQEILTGADGVLVAVDDPEALADGITDVLDRRASFGSADISARAIARFGWSAAAGRITALYREVTTSPDGDTLTGRGADRPAPSRSLPA